MVLHLPTAIEEKKKKKKKKREDETAIDVRAEWLLRSKANE